MTYLSLLHTHQEMEVIEGVQALLQQTLAHTTEQIRWVCRSVLFMQYVCDQNLHMYG